jgi:hypothetical protein
VDYKKLRHTQVLLDRENPRLPDGTSSDKEAINRLLAEGYEQLLALARDMVEQGESNPTELPIVVKEGAKYLVLEGNRRFAALKLIADPKLADEPGHQAVFARLKAKRTSPTTVQSAVAKNREQADHWIMLRHTGANNGVGVRRWSASQTATHRRRMKASVDSGTLRSLAIAEELSEAYQADDNLVELIKRIRAGKLTNIGRFFASDVLMRMQFEIRQTSDADSRSLWVRHTANELHPFFSWVLNFIEKNSVDAFKNKTLRDDLLNKHADLLPNPSNSLPEPRRLANHPYSPRAEHRDGVTGQDNSVDDTGRSEEATQENAIDTSSGSKNSRRKRDKKPERYLFSDVKLTNMDANVQRLLRESKGLPIEDNYAIACVLARVIVELAVSENKVLNWSGAKESDTLADKIRACIQKLDPEINNPKKRKKAELTQAFHEADGLGVAYMHQFMHNPAVKPDPHLARRFSHAFSPLLAALNEAVR